MFLLCQRTDTLPEMRVLVNTDHIVAVSPVSGGIKSRLSLANGEVWEVNLSFTRAISLLHAEAEIVEPVAPPVDRRRDPVDRRRDPGAGGPDGS